MHEHTSDDIHVAGTGASRPNKQNSVPVLPPKLLPNTNTSVPPRSGPRAGTTADTTGSRL